MHMYKPNRRKKKGLQIVSQSKTKVFRQRPEDCTSLKSVKHDLDFDSKVGYQGLNLVSQLTFNVLWI